MATEAVLVLEGAMATNIPDCRFRGREVTATGESGSMWAEPPGFDIVKEHTKGGE